MTLQEEGLDLSHRVERDADNNEQSGAAEELCRHVGNLKGSAEELGKNSDDHEKDGSREGQATHRVIEEVGGRLAWTHAGNESPVLFEVVRDLGGLELGGDPKITEGKDQHCVECVVDPADGELVGPVDRPRLVTECHVQDGRREKKYRLREDDRHDSRIVDLEGHVLCLSPVDLAADDSLGVLHADAAGRLRHGDDGCNHDKEKGTEDHKHHGTHGGGLASTGNKGAPGLNESGG